MTSKAGVRPGVTLVPEREMKAKRTYNSLIVIGVFLCILALGLINLYSASSGARIFYDQLKHMAVGLLAFATFAWVVPTRVLKEYSFWIFLFTVGLLAAVLILGTLGGGSKRWIHIGPIGGQPSELAKIAVAIMVAKFFAISKISRAYRIRDLWPVSLMVGAIVGLIFPQPDFGTAGFCFIIAAVQIMFVRLDWKSIGLVVALALAAAPITWNFLLKPYQRSRVSSFLNPEADLHGTGYNALQSIVAVGSGGLTGKGYLEGTQTQLQFLPMRHTDFVFSVFAEERGFWGSALLFMLFGSLAFAALEISRASKDTFNALLAIGVGALILAQFTINVAMVLRMFPVVGLPLPLFSYGGSSLITICAAVGILVSIDRNNQGLASPWPSLHSSRRKAQS